MGDTPVSPARLKSWPKAVPQEVGGWESDSIFLPPGRAWLSALVRTAKVPVVRLVVPPFLGVPKS